MAKRTMKLFQVKKMAPNGEWHHTTFVLGYTLRDALVRNPQYNKKHYILVLDTGRLDYRS